MAHRLRGVFLRHRADARLGGPLPNERAGELRLYSGPLSMFGAKAQIALHEKGIPFELVMVPFDMDRLYEPKHPEVLRVNPKRQVPVLIHGSIEIFDSTQIFEYLEDIAPKPALWPAEHGDRALARRLELESDEVFFPNIIRLMGLQDRLHDPLAIAALIMFVPQGIPPAERCRSGRARHGI